MKKLLLAALMLGACTRAYTPGELPRSPDSMPTWIRVYCDTTRGNLVYVSGSSGGIAVVQGGCR